MEKVISWHLFTANVNITNGLTFVRALHRISVKNFHRISWNHSHGFKNRCNIKNFVSSVEPKFVIWRTNQYTYLWTVYLYKVICYVADYILTQLYFHASGETPIDYFWLLPVSFFKFINQVTQFPQDLFPASWSSFGVSISLIPSFTQ